MSRHYFCDVCRFLDPMNKGATNRLNWRIEDTDWMLHLDSHTKMELILYTDYVINMLYENSGKYEIET